jgi:hypothetical protein
VNKERENELWKKFNEVKLNQQTFKALKPEIWAIKAKEAEERVKQQLKKKEESI